MGKTERPTFIASDWATLVRLANRGKEEPELEYEFSNGRKFYRHPKRKVKK